MAEYLIREESLVEIADAVRTHWGYYDDAMQMITDKNNLKNIIIPDNITTIGRYVFYGCGRLTKVIILDNITVIERDAFRYCSNLKDIYINSSAPPQLVDTNAFYSVTATIHVPIGSGDAYKNATNWSSFADKIVEDIEN